MDGNTVLGRTNVNLCENIMIVYPINHSIDSIYFYYIVDNIHIPIYQCKESYIIDNIDASMHGPFNFNIEESTTSDNDKIYTLYYNKTPLLAYKKLQGKDDLIYLYEYDRCQVMAFIGTISKYSDGNNNPTIRLKLVPRYKISTIKYTIANTNRV